MENKVVAIVSINMHTHMLNYGSALQSWAMKEVINSLGYHAKLIDYCPDILKDKDPLNPMKNMWDKDDETRKFEQEEKHAEFEPFEYYIDIHDKSLIRLNKDTNEWYEFVVNQHEGNLTKTWMKLNKTNEKDLKRIYNYQKVIDYTDKYIEDIKNGIDDVNVDIDEITKKDYLTLQEKWEIDDKLLDSTLNNQIKD